MTESDTFFGTMWHIWFVAASVDNPVIKGFYTVAVTREEALRDFKNYASHVLKTNIDNEDVNIEAYVDNVVVSPFFKTITINSD